MRTRELRGRSTFIRVTIRAKLPILSLVPHWWTSISLTLPCVWKFVGISHPALVSQTLVDTCSFYSFGIILVALGEAADRNLWTFCGNLCGVRLCLAVSSYGHQIWPGLLKTSKTGEPLSCKGAGDREATREAFKPIGEATFVFVYVLLH